VETGEISNLSFNEDILKIKESIDPGASYPERKRHSS
jgi:hypothetical protein